MENYCCRGRCYIIGPEIVAIGGRGQEVAVVFILVSSFVVFMLLTFFFFFFFFFFN